MMPPALLIVGIRRVRIPLPLFLLWPLVALAWLLLSLLWLLAGLPPRGRLRGGLTALTALSAVKGLTVDVQDGDDTIYLKFI